ncbi:MAG: sulfotransferase [Henriciella sp.]
MTSQPSHIALAERAETLAEEGDLAGAISKLKAALKEKPSFFQGWLRLSKHLFEAEHFAEAVQVVRAAERFDPLGPDFQFIQNKMQDRAFGDAGRRAREMLAKQPGHPRAVYTIAQLADLNNNAESKVAALLYGLTHSPANMMLRNMLITACEQAGDYSGAIEAARLLVRTEESFPSLWSLVSILLRYGQNQELLDVCMRAESLAGGDTGKLSEVELVRGQILRVMGQREQSVAAYRACLAHNPSNAGAWWALADMKNYAFTQADRTAIETLLRGQNLSDADKCVAKFALAKASETHGDFDASMGLYNEANRLYPKATFNPSQFADAVSARIGAFNSDALRQQADRAPSSAKPIFILGLPRAGSTLLEQILASHSQIEGTIEQPVLPSIARKAHVKCALTYQGDILQKIGELTPTELSELGAAYLDDGALFRSGASDFFTDKLPFNFLHVGLIHKLLPEAIIIDARRNPMDCGLSLYKQHFPTGVDFSYDLGHIGAYYNQYLKLMDHWDSVLPRRVYHVQYEALVRNPEAQIRALLHHVGVEFEEACVNFHATDRAVRTASSEQVRQPINSRGIGAWRRVAAHLQPLKDSLGAATLARFEADLDLNP